MSSRAFAILLVLVLLGLWVAAGAVISIYGGAP
jgi:hypothetical protein